ncbi:MAG: hypothetical protein ACLT69_15070 [Intestinibacter bartlettii]
MKKPLEIFSLGDINIKTDLESSIRSTTNFIDISNYIKYDYISINKRLDTKVC